MRKIGLRALEKTFGAVVDQRIDVEQISRLNGIGGLRTAVEWRHSTIHKG